MDTLPSSGEQVVPAPAEAKGLDGTALPPGEKASLWQAFSEARREIQPLSPGDSALPINAGGVKFFAFNPGQQLTARFLDDAVRIESGLEKSKWQATFETKGGGPASIVVSGARLEYRRGRNIEWYENREEGLEHGFVVHERPSDAPAGTLRVDVNVKGLSARASASVAGGVELITAEGEPVLSYGKLAVWDSSGRAMASRLDATPDGIAITVADAGARYPLTIDPLIGSLEQKLGPEITGTGDGFSGFESLSGDTAVLSARGPGGWSACVFVRSGTTWSLQARLRPNDTAGGFEANANGPSVSVSGNTVVVGANGSNLSNPEAAYVFVRSGTSWSQEAKLMSDVPRAGSNGSDFGASVSVDGNTVLVGEPQGYTTTGESVWTPGTWYGGFVYVFQRSGTSWTLQAKLKGSQQGPVNKYNFGPSVSLSGNTALVGAPWEGSDHDGAAYVFERSGTTWSLQQRISPEELVVLQNGFGTTVSLDGNTAVMGTSRSFAQAGYSYVFERSGTTWSQTAKFTTPDPAANDAFGRFVGVSGDTALVNSALGLCVYLKSGSSWGLQTQLVSVASGTAFIDGSTLLVISKATGENGKNLALVFTRSGAMWTQQAALTTGDAAEGDKFGSAVSLDGDTALIGAYLDDSPAGLTAGSAYVLVRSGTTWSQQAKLTASDGGVNDQFGFSVSVSGDTALVGAQLYGPTGVKDAGSVYVFTRSGTSWSQEAKLTASGGASDQFGYSVGVSGNTALIGAPWNDTSVGGYTDGSAYVFVRSGASWSQEAKLTAASTQLLGTSVSLDGDTALVGGQYSARVFVRSGAVWSLQATLAVRCNAVSLSGDTALLGDVASYTTTGRAYAFVRSGAAWSMQAVIAPNDGVAGDSFGCSVSVSNNTALIGAVGTGSAYLFERAGGTWRQQARLTDSGGELSFGSSVSVSGDTCLVGAPGDDGVNTMGDPVVDQGSAFAFRLAASPDVDGDGFGIAVGGDCNDNDPAINPGAEEVRNGLDENCNGRIDEGLERGGVIRFD